MLDEHSRTPHVFQRYSNHVWGQSKELQCRCTELDTRPRLSSRDRPPVGLIDNKSSAVIISNMKAELLLRERHLLNETAFAELRIWRVPTPVRGSAHIFKYSLAYVTAGQCVLRYDNEAGKGDHKQLGAVETAYEFTTPAALLADFWRDVDRWRPS
jgi:hypothetical protein